MEKKTLSYVFSTVIFYTPLDSNPLKMWCMRWFLYINYSYFTDLESSRRGSLPGRSPNIERNFALGHLLLFEDYFRERPTYNEKHFIRRFRMTKDMFLMIKNDLESHDEYFTLRCNAAGKMGLSPLQKCTAALRMLIGREHPDRWIHDVRESAEVLQSNHRSLWA